MDGAEIFDWKVVGSGGENVNESRKRSMERRNEYEINSIPPSAAWRNSMHLYALAGKASFCFPVYRLFSPRSRLPLPPPFFPFSSPPRYLFPPSLLRYIFERLFTRLVAQFHRVVVSSKRLGNDNGQTGGERSAEKSRPASRYCSSL